MQTLFHPIRVPADLLVSLGEFTGNFWSDGLALEPFICEAIRNYIQPAPAVQTQATAPTQAGYQWKQVFLPEGTRLRARFGGRSYFARVEGEEIKHGEQAMSPSRFANLQGSGNRNAWKAIWLCLPGSDEWLLADVCRSARKAAIARLLGDDVPAEQPPQARKRPKTKRHTAKRRAAKHLKRHAASRGSGDKSGAELRQATEHPVGSREGSQRQTESRRSSAAPEKAGRRKHRAKHPPHPKQ